MEEFDALMIRVNNIYYGRGKLMMSPENPNEKLDNQYDYSRATPELSCRTSNNKVDTGEDRHTEEQSSEVEKSAPLNKPSLGQMIVVDNIIELSQKPNCLGFEGSHKGQDLVVPVDLKMTDDSRENQRKDPLPFTNDTKVDNPRAIAKSKQKGSGTLDINTTDYPNSAKVVDQGPRNQSSKNMASSSKMLSKVSDINIGDNGFPKKRISDGGLLSKKQSTQAFEHQDCNGLMSTDPTESERKHQSFHKPVKIDEKLLNNPWLSGEIAGRTEAQERKNPETFFRDTSLMFRDKIRQWKSEHDIRNGWEGLQHVEITEAQRSLGARPEDKSLEKDMNNNEAPQRNYSLRGGRSTSQRLTSNGYEVKVSKDDRIDPKMRGGPLKDEFSFPRVKEQSLSKSHGNLSSIGDKETEIKRNGGGMSRDDGGSRKFIDVVLATTSCLKPAKSLSNLIGHFESFVDEKKVEQQPIRQDKQEVSPCDEEKKKRVENFSSDRYDVRFEMQSARPHHRISQDLSVTDKGLGRDTKSRTEEKQTEPKGQRYENNHDYFKNRAYNVDRKDVVESGLEWPKIFPSSSNGTKRAPNERQPFRSSNSYNAFLDAKDGEEKTGNSRHKARDILSDKEKLVASERNMKSMPMMSSERFKGSEVANSLLDKEKPAVNLTQNEDKISTKYSAYQERLEGVGSRSRMYEPSFEAKIMKWKSLDELRMKFEANDNESLEDSDWGYSDDERVQQAIIDGMAKYAEQKFGRKRAAPKGSKGSRSAMDDYEIYLRSLRSKVKTSQDKLNIVNKQKKEIEEKVKKAEQEVEKQEKTLQDAEDEKRAAEREGREPKLPSGYVVPQTAKKAVQGAGFANLVMKASAQLWEDKFMAMRAKKGGSEGQPEWMAKSKRSDKILLNVGKKGGHKKEEEQKPAWSTNLKKAEPRRRMESKHDDSSKAAFANVSLRKTAKKEEEEETGSRKVDWKEMEKKSATTGSSRRRRGGDDSD